MQDLTPITANTATIAQTAAGADRKIEATRLGAIRMAQLEQAGFELGRCGRSFVAGIALVAGGVVPVVDLPTTTGPVVVFNSNPAGGKAYHIKQVSSFYASGTGGAAGHGLFGAVTNGPLATALTANGATNFKSQLTRGYGAVTAFIDVAKTIPAGSAWMILGGIIHLANTVTGPAFSADVRHLGFVVPPGYAFVAGVLGDTGSTAKFGITVAGDEIDADLP